MALASNVFKSGIRPNIDAWLLDKAQERRNYGEYWSGSSAGYCMRRQIFERLGVPYVKDGDPRLQRVFTAGHVFHSWLQEITRESGLSVAQEGELIDDTLMVKGHFDDLVLIPGARTDSPKRLVLYDYKSVNSKSFSYTKANHSEMSHYHKMQLGTYMYMLRKPGKYSKPEVELNEGRILKISKDDLRMDEQVLYWDKLLEKAVVQYWHTLNGYWRAVNESQSAQMLPNCTCDKFENGFLAREKFNPYWFNGKPCSMEYFKEWAKGKEKDDIYHRSGR